jgi:transposase
VSANFNIPLDIPDVEILKIETNKTEDLIITVKSTKDSTPCHKCGNEAKRSNGYGETIMLQHLPILGRQVFIRIKLARYQYEICDDKPTTTEQTSWFNRRSKFTKAYEEYLMRSLINSTISDVSRKEGVSYDDIEGVLDRQIKKTN